MGNRIFKISYILFIVSMLVLLLLDRIRIISFGADESDALTAEIMLLICFVSLFIFAAVNRIRKENSSVNIIRGLLAILMIVILAFILNDLSVSHAA